MREAPQQWAMFVALASVVIVAMGSMTYTLNARMGAIETRMGAIETRVENLDAKVDEKFEQLDEKFEQLDAKFEQLDAKFEQLDAKFDKLLIALAGRGVTLPAKSESKHPEKP